MSVSALVRRVVMVTALTRSVHSRANVLPDTSSHMMDGIAEVTSYIIFTL